MCTLNYKKHSNDCTGSVGLESVSWIKVFSHDISGGLFTGKSDTLSKNPDNPCAALFSILDTLEDMRLEDNSFHLKICYPEEDKCNEWVQTSNLATKKKITGFKAIKLAFPKSGTGRPFHGLGLNPAGHSAIIDADPDHGNWWYAIGSLKPYSGGIPGPNVKISKVELFAEKSVKDDTSFPVSCPSESVDWHGQCVIDSRCRLLPHKMGNSGTNTPQECSGQCKSSGFKFFGVQASSECFCGNSAPPISSLRPDECKYPCSGDDTQFCGGGWRMNVAELLPTVWTEFPTLHCAPGVSSTAISSLTGELDECKEACATTQGCIAIVHMASSGSCTLIKEVLFHNCYKEDEAKVSSGDYWNTYVVGEGKTHYQLLKMIILNLNSSVLLAQLENVFGQLCWANTGYYPEITQMSWPNTEKFGLSCQSNMEN